MTEYLYGRNVVLETLRANRREIRVVQLAQGTKEAHNISEITALCQERHVPVERVPRQKLRNLVSTDNHQGVVASAGPYPYVGVDRILEAAESSGELPLLLLLDRLQDPQNLGTLLRTAEAVGVHGVIVPERRSAKITPAVSKASAGAVEHLRVADVTNLSQTMDVLKQAGIWIVGLEDVPEAQHYRDVDLCCAMALVVGSEGSGLRRLTRERCDLLVKLPMGGQISSLNAAVAGSVALYEAWEQRRERHLTEQVLRDRETGC